MSYISRQNLMSKNVKQDLINMNVNSNLSNVDTNNSSDDIKQQAAINNALINAGLPQNKLNGLISMAKDRLLCNSECQKNRESASLKKIWENSKTNLKTAPEQVEIAEKNYYIFDKGVAQYKDLIFDRYSKTAEEMKQSSIKKHKILLDELNTLIASYDAGTIYSKRMHELLKVRREENKKLKNSIDDFIGTTQTDARKVDYENIESTWISTVRKGLKYIYYSLFVIYFLISDYFRTEKYKSKKVWLFIVLYIMFPFFLNWIIIQLYYLKKYIHHVFINRPFKNVYMGGSTPVHPYIGGSTPSPPYIRGFAPRI